MTNQSVVADNRYRYCLGDSSCAGMSPDGPLYGAGEKMGSDHNSRTFLALLMAQYESPRIRDAAQVWALNELEPVQVRLAQVNEWLGEEVIRFRRYELPGQA